MNENDNIAVSVHEPKSECESRDKITTLDATIPLSAEEGVKVSEFTKNHFFTRCVHFAVTVLLPGALALFSLAVILSSAALLLSNFDFSKNGIIRLMLGDIAGGYVNIAVSGEINHLKPSPELMSDRGTLITNKIKDTTEKVTELPTLINETPYKPDMEAILNSPRSVLCASDLYAKYGNDAPIVLIIHTHGTESFSGTALTEYRSFEESKNVIHLGRIIADKLTERGIGVIHCTKIFDSPDFGLAYYNASVAIREYIQEYPSISYVIDIHRDSIELEDGSHFAPIVDTELGSAAGLMFVIGTDHGGSGHTEWEDNLSLAARLHCAINTSHPGIMRSINLRSASFNEQYTKGSLLVEVGATASTLDEVELSAKIFAEHLAAEILGY